MLVSARALTVLVVAHNDSQKLFATIDRIYNALAVTVEEFSIVVFDDGSTDDTLAVAKAATEKYPFVVVRRNQRRRSWILHHCGKP
jgi:glycosyltransferase involved in cell wall biosynthesis